MTSVPETVEQGAAPSAAPRGPVVGPRVAAGVLLVVGIFLLVNAIGAAARDGVTLGGPRLAPLVVTAGWFVLAAVYCVQQILRPQGQRFGLSTPLLVVAALVSYALVLKYTMVGYVISTAVFFLIIARLLSGPRCKFVGGTQGVVGVCSCSWRSMRVIRSSRSAGVNFHLNGRALAL